MPFFSCIWFISGLKIGLTVTWNPTLPLPNEAVENGERRSRRDEVVRWSTSYLLLARALRHGIEEFGISYSWAIRQSRGKNKRYRMDVQKGNHGAYIARG